MLIPSLAVVNSRTSLAEVVAMRACATDLTSGRVAVQTAVPLTARSPRHRRLGIILAHGLSGGVDSFDPEIVAALRGDGFFVLRGVVPPIDTVAQRAAALAPQVDDFIASNQLDEVHIIAHSMGGLDSRYLISTLGYASKITSLTTIGTPHRGTPIADVVLGLSRDGAISVTHVLLALTDVIGTRVDVAQLKRALVDLTEARAPAFNAANPDAPEVKYFSYAGYSTVFGLANRRAHALCSSLGVPTPSPSSLPGELNVSGLVIGGLAFRPHDGVVPIDSAVWTGFLGCLPTDHLDMTRAGQKAADDLDLDLVAFYRRIGWRIGEIISCPRSSSTAMRSASSA